MIRKVEILVLALALTASAGVVGAAQNWRLTLPDTLALDRDTVTVGDIAGGPVPAGAQDIVVRAGLKPNAVVTVSRRDILRRLVTAGQARGVSFGGAEQIRLVFRGREVTPEKLREAVSRQLQPLVPPARSNAPDSWFELELPPVAMAAAASWQVIIERTELLAPGRNLVRIGVLEGARTESVTATVTLHQYGEVGRLRSDVTGNSPLEENMFDWEWRDLAETDRGLADGRDSIRGFSSTRDLAAGRYLREADLKATPLIRTGDPVELQVRRGQVAVSVRAIARQNGCLGQTIPVRSELTGQLVNARVAGPGIVEWRR